MINRKFTREHYRGFKNSVLTNEIVQKMNDLGFIYNGECLEEVTEYTEFLDSYCLEHLTQLEDVKNLLKAKGFKKNFLQEHTELVIHRLIKSEIGANLKQNITYEEVVNRIKKGATKFLYISPQTKAKLRCELAGRNINFNDLNVFVLDGIEFNGGLLVDKKLEYYLEVDYYNANYMSLCDDHLRIGAKLKFGVSNVTLIKAEDNDVKEGFEFLQPLWDAGITLPYKQDYQGYYIAENRCIIGKDGFVYNKEDFDFETKEFKAHEFFITYPVDRYIRYKLASQLYNCCAHKYEATDIKVGATIKDLNGKEFEDGKYTLVVEIENGKIKTIGGCK